MDNETAGAKCFGMGTCNDCITNSACGFCFRDFESGANGTCLTANPNDTAKNSIYGECYDGTMAEEKLVWAYNWCPNKYSWMTLFGLCVYLLFFGPGLGPMPWTINSEIYPLWARSTCFATTTSFNWFFNFLISLTFLTLTETITKQGAFWLYAGFGMVGFAYFVMVLPETKGKTLGDAEALFGGKDKARSNSEKKGARPI